MSTANLEDVPRGKRIFLDATIFLYHFFGQSAQCRHLLHRCERREVQGITSVVVFNEVSHRLMVMEALRSGVVTPGNVPRKLRERPDLVRALRQHVEDLRSIPGWGIEVLPVELDRSLRAADLRLTAGLLTNDSIICETMREEGISAIATAHTDFARVEGLQVFRPTDLESARPALA